MKASELFVECLKAEGVRYIFGLPGEENIEFLYSLRNSGIEFITTRDERGAAFMANAWGRMTGKPGVCLSTLGPGATNLLTGVADAFLDFAPLVALTAQSPTGNTYKELHQYIDVVSMYRPITKWNATIHSPRIIPEIMRKAFKLAASEKPGPTHIEIPSDVNLMEADGKPIFPKQRAHPVPPEAEIKRAAEMIASAEMPIVLAGNGILRGDSAPAFKNFIEQLCAPVVSTFMGLGAIPADHDLFISSVGLQSRDYALCGLERADLIIAVGYDPVEFSPRYWGGPKEVVHIDYTPAEVDENYRPHELTGCIRTTLENLCRTVKPCGVDASYCKRLKEQAGTLEARANHSGGGYPVKPARILLDLKENLDPDGVLISDVGAHKMWISKFYPASKPNTVFISNGFASMGFAIPAAMSASLLWPKRPVVAAVGDGGFLMSMAELETAKRLGLDMVVLVWRDGGYGLIEWKERNRYKEEFYTKFDNPDIVALTESFGLRGYRVEREGQLGRILKEALSEPGISVIDCPVDYEENILLTKELGSIICPT